MRRAQCRKGPVDAKFRMAAHRRWTHCVSAGRKRDRIVRHRFIVRSVVCAGSRATGTTADRSHRAAGVRGAVYGANPRDCGQHALARALLPAGAKDLQQSLACASAASKDRKPFWTFRQDQGIDSLGFQGLIGTIDGIVYQFWYDSAPCGGPGCSGRFSLSRCDNPTVLVNRNGTSDFGCDDVRRVIPTR